MQAFRACANIPIGFLFVVSGATTLAYQTIWFQQLAHIWGSSTISMAAIVSSFLLGLALGARLFTRVLRRRVTQLRLYGAAEAVIGAWAIMLPYILPLVSICGSYLHFPDSQYPVLQFFVRAVLAFVVLAPACILMGGTLPLLVGFESLSAGRPKAASAWLYGINTLGAAIGCFISGFWLLPTLGLYYASILVAGVNLSIGLLALLKSCLLSDFASPERSNVVSKWQKSDSAAICASPAVVLAALLCGIASLVLEMVWFRQLAVVVGGSTYAFTAALSVALAGMGAGSLLYYWCGELRAQRDDICNTLVATICLLAIATAAGKAVLPNLSLFVGAVRPLRQTLLNNALVCACAAIAIEAIAATAMGFLFPALIAVHPRARRAEHTVTGSLYFWNTIGGVIGAIAASSCLVPLLGISGAMSMSLILYLAAALVLLAGFRQLRFATAAAPVVVCAVAVGICIATDNPLRTDMGMYVYGPQLRSASTNNVLFFAEGAHCNVLVTEGEADGRALRVNGKVDATDTGDQRTQLGLAYFPRFLNPQARSIFIIGYGSGTTAGASLLFPRTEVTCCEIEPRVFDAGRLFSQTNHEPWNSPLFDIVFDDARGHLQRTSRQFDIIISEPSNPWLAGVSSLYTVEFYRSATTRLKENGIFAQWVQAYNLTTHEFRLIARSMLAAFPHVGLIRLSAADVLLVGSATPLGADASILDAVQADVSRTSTVRSDLQKHFDSDDVRSLLLEHYLLDTNALRALVHSDGRPLLNTDANMRLEYDAPLHLFRPRQSTGEIVSVAIDRAIRADWYRQCIETWKCSRNQVNAAKSPLCIVLLNGTPEASRAMLSICEQLDSNDQFFVLIKHVLNADASVTSKHFEMISLSSEDYRRATMLGTALLEYKRTVEASCIFRHLTAQVEVSPTAWVGLANTYLAVGDNVNALECFGRALAADPMDTYSYRELKRLSN
jgi:spermidine synthase